MGAFVTKWRIRALMARIDVLRQDNARLESQFTAASTDAEKDKIKRLFDKNLKQSHSMQLMLELLERRDRRMNGG
jgi:hypothetical protein